MFEHANKFKKHELDITFTDVGKMYKVPDSYYMYPSVTTVLGNNTKKKDSLDQWRQKIGLEEAKKITNRSARIGTNVHLMVEKYLLNKENYLPKDKVSHFIEISLFDSIKPFLDRLISVVHLQEACVWSHILKVAGQIDLVCEIDGKLSIVDFKTSLRPKKREWIHDYFLQTACYSFMFQEVYGEKISRNVILMSNMDGDPNVQVFESNPSDMRTDPFFKTLIKSTTYN